MSDGAQRSSDHGHGGEAGGGAFGDEGQDDSALKTLQVISKSSKMLRAGHALVDNQSIQKRFAGAPGQTSLYRYEGCTTCIHLAAVTDQDVRLSTQYGCDCSHPSFSLFKLVGMEPLGPPRAALFDIDEKFMHAIPVSAGNVNISTEELGQLVSEPEKPIMPVISSPKAHHKHEKHAKKEKKEKKVCATG